jgi:hypothetical protein
MSGCNLQTWTVKAQPPLHLRQKPFDCFVFLVFIPRLSLSIAHTVGWGALSMLRKLKADQYNVTIVSPRNYFLFTPLLPSTTTGLINIQAIIEPIRDYCRRANASHAKYAVWRLDRWAVCCSRICGRHGPGNQKRMNAKQPYILAPGSMKRNAVRSTPTTIRSSVSALTRAAARARYEPPAVCACCASYSQDSWDSIPEASDHAPCIYN